MINPYRTMYLRPGNFWKQFTVKRLKVRMVGGYSVEEYVDTDICITGVLSEATAKQAEMVKNRYDQSQHALTHTLVIVGRAFLKKGDMITTHNRTFLVLVTDDVAVMGLSNIVYLEERNDINDTRRSCEGTGKGC